jgi:hypothetical protein
MVVSNVVVLALVWLICAVLQNRMERNRWFVGLLFLWLPVLALTVVWATVSASWPEALLGTGIGLALGVVYYVVIGRRLHPADSSGIKVWGQDVAPRPRAALQVEIDHLRDEKAKLEAELRRLRESEGDAGSAPTGDPDAR